MSVFNQDLGRTPITANVIQSAIREGREQRPTCHITEEELENVIADVLENIYYSCKIGKSPLDQTWRFDIGLFGIKRLPDVFWKEAKNLPAGKAIIENHQKIKDYIMRRFAELGFECDFSVYEVIISIPLTLAADYVGALGTAAKVYANSIASELASVVPMDHPEGLFLM